jgi:hypothetical protein
MAGPLTGFCSASRILGDPSVDAVMDEIGPQPK